MAEQSKTLRELCESLGVSRRAVQGYEKHGLVRATGRSERGWLLYNSSAQERIRRIRQYQEFGFSIKEIQILMQAPAAEQRRLLELQRQRMLRRRSRLEEDLQQITAMIAALT